MWLTFSEDVIFSDVHVNVRKAAYESEKKDAPELSRKSCFYMFVKQNVFHFDYATSGSD